MIDYGDPNAIHRHILYPTPIIDEKTILNTVLTANTHILLSFFQYLLEYGANRSS